MAAALLALAALVAGLGTVPVAAQPIEVTRLAGTTRIETAVAVSERFWPSADVAVVATARAFPDALVAGSLASRLDAPILLTEPRGLPQPVADELARLGADEVVVLGGEAAVGAGVVAAIEALPTAPSVARVAGEDRHATAAAVARLAAPDETAEVLVASSSSFPDALAAASLVAVGDQPLPVLLTTRDELPAETFAVLEDLGPSRATILGGSAVVGEGVHRELAAGVDQVTRVAGPDRLSTAAAVAEAALDRRDDAPRPLVVTSGQDYPDALAAGALVARLDAVLLLSPRLRLTDTLDELLRHHAARFDEVVVVGGTAALGANLPSELMAALSGAPRPAFEGAAAPLSEDVRDRMRGVSWRPGCPAGLEALAYVELNHWDFDGALRDGELVVAADVAESIVAVFAELFTNGVPIDGMRLVDDYGGDDDASMAANNTSGFNCRTVAGSDDWSEHAYGLAVDVNPVQNPYVRGSVIEPPAGAAYLDRSDVRPGMAVRPGPMVEAFEAIGWGWGGDFRSLKDYQHFSSTGR